MRKFTDTTKKSFGSRKKRGTFVNRAMVAKLKVKKGDTVMVISGKDKGKKGEVLRAIPSENRVVVEGIALVKRHLKKGGKGQSGRIAERPASIHASNVKVVDAAKPARAKAAKKVTT